MDSRPAFADLPIDWDLARKLPAPIADPWGEPAMWQSLFERRLAGQRYLELPGFIQTDAARAVREAVLGLPWRRLMTELVSAERHLLASSDMPMWLDFMQDETLRRLIAGVLGREMPRGLVVNAWRMRHGDHMGIHPDGRLYYGTFSLGLCEQWQPEDGGAIAFGARTDLGELAVEQRWYPRLGDACVFAPAADTWHAVEPVRSLRTRLSLTGWWTLPEDGLTRGA